MDKFLKIGLAILLFICLSSMPYGYYQLVRFIAMVSFVLLAYYTYRKGSNIEAIIYLCLALLFQPLIKIVLSRYVWNFVDIIVGIGLIVSIFIRPSTNQQ